MPSVVYASISPNSPNSIAISMKKLEFVIKPYKLDLVRDLLADFEIQGMTVTEVREFVSVPMNRTPFQLSSGESNFAPMLKVEILAPDIVVDGLQFRIAKHLEGTAESSIPLMVLPVAEALRIRTGEPVDE